MDWLLPMSGSGGSTEKMTGHLIHFGAIQVKIPGAHEKGGDGYGA